jgi:hypothetical protein
MNATWIKAATAAAKEYFPEGLAIGGGVGAILAHPYIRAAEVSLQAASVVAGGISLIALRRTLKRVHRAVRHRRRP